MDLAGQLTGKALAGVQWRWKGDFHNKKGVYDTIGGAEMHGLGKQSHREVENRTEGKIGLRKIKGI